MKLDNAYMQILTNEFVSDLGLSITKDEFLHLMWTLEILESFPNNADIRNLIKFCMVKLGGVDVRSTIEYRGRSEPLLRISFSCIEEEVFVTEKATLCTWGKTICFTHLNAPADFKKIYTDNINDIFKYVDKCSELQSVIDGIRERNLEAFQNFWK